MDSLKDKLRKFANERDWNQFHTPKNLAMALSGEVGELVEVFQWLTAEESESLSPKQRIKAEEEIADVYLYLLRLADKLDINLDEVAAQKLELNEKKYPVDKAKGNAKKYSDFD